MIIHIPFSPSFTQDSFTSISSDLPEDQQQKVVDLMLSNGYDIKSEGVLGDGDTEVTDNGFDLKKFCKKVAIAVKNTLVKLYRKGVTLTKSIYLTVLRFFTGHDPSAASSVDVKINDIVDKAPLFVNESSNSEQKHTVKIQRKKSDKMFTLVAYDDQGSLMYMDSDDAKIARRVRAIFSILTRISLTIFTTALVTVVSMLTRMYVISKHSYYNGNQGYVV